MPRRERNIPHIGNLLTGCFFLSQLTLQTDAIGVIVYAALGLGGISGTRTIVMVQAAGAIAALLLLSLIRASRCSMSANAVIAAAAVPVAITIACGPPAAHYWKAAILTRVCLGTLLSSRLAALVPLCMVDDALPANKRLQIAGSLAMLIGAGAGPLIANWGGPRALFILDAVIMAFLLLPLHRLTHGIRTTIEPGLNPAGPGLEARLSSILSHGAILEISGLTLGAWLIAGVFHVVEVPFLLHWLKATPAQVSAAFVATLLSSLVAMRLCRTRTIESAPQLAMILSTVGVIAFSVLYLYSPTYPIAVVSVCGLGAMNGLFNLSQTSRIQMIPDMHLREVAFAWLRFISQIALLASVTLAQAGPIGELRRLLLVLGAGLSVAITWPVWRRFLPRAAVAVILLAWLSPRRALADDDGRTLTVAVHSLPASPYPWDIMDGGSTLVLGQIYETLYEYDPNNILRLALAKRHIWSLDLKTLRIKINRDKRWWDGSRVVATDVANALASTTAHLGARVKWAMGEVRGFAEFIQDPVKNRHLFAIRPLDDETVEIRFRSPFALMPAILASPTFGIFKSRPGHEPLGTGLYRLSNHTEQQWTLEQPSRMDAGSGPARIVFRKFSDQDSLLASIPLRQVDIFEAPAKDISAERHYRRVDYPYLQAVVLMPNASHPIFADPAVRCDFLAQFYKAVKRSDYTWSPISVGLPFSWGMTHSAAASSTRESPQEPMPIEIDFADSVAKFEDAKNDQLTRLMQTSPYRISFRRYPISELVRRAQDGSSLAVMLGYVPDYIHPDGLLTPMLGTGEQFNLSHYSDPVFDDMLRRARRTNDRGAQNAYYGQAFERIGKMCPIAFLGTQRGSLFVSRFWNIPPIRQLGFPFLKFKEFSRRNTP